MIRRPAVGRRLLLFGLLVGLAAGAQPMPAAPLGEIREILGRELLPEPDAAVLEALAFDDLRGDLRQLDPYADWFPAPGTGDMPAGAGIAAELEVDPDGTWLLPRQGGPLAQAGFRDRVQLLAVGGRSVSGLDAVQVAGLVRGEPGSRVRLLLVRPGEPLRYDVTLLREHARLLDVERWDVGGTTVLRITDFAAGRTRTALAATLERLPGGDDPVVIDLRYAGGGDLYEAIDMAGMLLEPGTELCSVRGRGETAATYHATRGSPNGPPLFLLVGPATASAAEVFAGILQFHRRARLAGQPTFGKCQAQTERRLSDGSLLRFTNREVHFPDHSTCTGAGLVPDLPVSQEVLPNLERTLRRLPVAPDTRAGNAAPPA
ncbi:Carboxyl-terminal protease [Thioalkalivibrio nitratireducens DSM 14787]|uniref:Carboxyl-terminal protease n=1 Tax=Thioalkalivibrio nitratireducens (strain DSM 14787 / UNIQEM 213 / ALEN2) TaxID=1255043 RepID=L0DYU0_THIND|nr:S41 family peptidase [Thioalkalivibrio nitratireducens]AGA34172.1 Carboxyl-terminal protease [Thioalkalivibrio nitratireducens DSM 14787]